MKSVFCILLLTWAFALFPLPMKAEGNFGAQLDSTTEGKTKVKQPITTYHFDFCGIPFQFDFQLEQLAEVQLPLTEEGVHQFWGEVLAEKNGQGMKGRSSLQSDGSLQQIASQLVAFKAAHQLEDWLFYQLIRQTVQHFSPKSADYLRYTLYKWILLELTGFKTMGAVRDNKMLFYVQCDENIYNIPFRMYGEAQYVCLNYHDYGQIDFNKEIFSPILPPAVAHEKKIGTTEEKTFSYQITRLPEFQNASIVEKELRFTYYLQPYSFRVALNKDVEKLFTNYPVVDYAYTLNIPLSKQTYGSLIPVLKKQIAGRSQRYGIDYLMRFTRYAFLFSADTEEYGSEKRLTPEQTLLFEKSDCEDRVALFYFLVKEIYNLPMIILAFDDHVTVGVHLEKPVGQGVEYLGRKYSICEPTPQKKDLMLGKTTKALKQNSFEVVYAYEPTIK